MLLSALQKAVDARCVIVVLSEIVGAFRTRARLMKLLHWLSELASISINTASRRPQLITRQSARRSAPQHRRPGFEQLEARTLLTSFTVDTLTDGVDVSPGDGAAADSSGNATLRAAIQEANALAGDDVIMLPAGTFTFNLTGRGEDAAATGDLDITGNVTIIGAGAADTIIDFDSSDRIFDIHPGATVTISGVTLREGNLSSLADNGAAVRNQGTLLIEQSILINNSTSGGGGAIFNAEGADLTVRNASLGGNSAVGPSGGGAVYNQGVATIEQSTLENNTGIVRAGGIYNSGASADLTVIDSTLSQNSTNSNRDGGGVYNTGQLRIERSTFEGNIAQNGAGLFTTTDGSFVEIFNSTFSANHAERGGAIYIDAPVNLSIPIRVDLFQSTITDNIADIMGGGIYNDGPFGAFVAGGSIIIANSTTASTATADVRGGVSSLGYNLFGTSITTGEMTDLSISDAMLGPLANNGGPTKTHALLPGSQAIDASHTSLASLVVDQRGLARSIDGEGDGTATPDIGAFELQPFTYTADTATNMRLRLNGTTLLLIDLSDQSIIDSYEYADTPTLTINGSSEDDSLDIDFSGGNPVPTGGLTFNAGSQTSTGDVLSLSNGSFNSVAHSFLSSSDGDITLDNGSAQFTIDYTGLEPITDNILATDRTFSFDSAGPHDVTLSDDASPGDNINRLASVSTSETVDFLSPSGTVLITTGSGDDTVTLAGVDSLFAGGVRVLSGDGADRLDASALLFGVTLDGEAGNDSLFGGAGHDSLRGSSDQDSIVGGDGNDSLFGGAGVDALYGGAGNDIVRGQGSSGDTVSGGLGDDVVDGGGNDRLFESEDASMTLTETSMTGIGNDVIIGITSVFLFGGDSNNVIDVSAYPFYTQLYGLGGDDLLIGGEGRSVILGSDGDDTIIGNGGDDVLRGSAGADSLVGGAGDDRLLGQGGSRDTLRGGEGDDSLDGGAGNDIIFELALTDSGNYTIEDRRLTGLGNDTVKNVERVRLDAGDGDNLIDGSAFTGDLIIDARAGNDTVLGGSGNDVIYGAAGNDLIRSGAGNDIVFGHEGDDTLNGGAGDDTLDGGDGADGLSGWTGSDSLLGGAGNDTLYGGDDADTLSGGTGNDTLQGGAGDDVVSGDDDSDSDTLGGGSGGGAADAGDTVNSSGADVIDEAFNLTPTPDWVDQI